MPMFTLRNSSAEASKSPEIQLDSSDTEHWRSLIDEYAQDKQKASILAWLAAAGKPVHIRALNTAVALFNKPGCSTLAELDEHNPLLTEESLKEAVGAIVRIKGDKVSLQEKAGSYFATDRPLHYLPFWDSKGLDFSIVKAFVTYLSLDDFRDLPLPTDWKGMRSDLHKSDPFLTYASCNWHKIDLTVDDAKALEPRLDTIIDPTKKNVYLWTDQSCGRSSSGGPREYIHSRAEIAIKYDIRWLAVHLIESASEDLENMFPARDLPTVVRKAPKVFQLLLDRKPEYYRPKINRRILMEVAKLRNESAETLQLLLGDSSDLNLPVVFLREVAGNMNGDQMFKFLFSKKENFPITTSMLHEAARNSESSGDKILGQFFNYDTSIRVDEETLNTALRNGSHSRLEIILAHDPDAPITSKTLDTAMSSAIEIGDLKYVLDTKPDLLIPPDVVEYAAANNREGAIKMLFENRKDLKVTEAILKKAAHSEGHEIAMTEFLLSRSEPELITYDVVLRAIRRPNSPHKMVAILLKHNDEIQITDEFLIASLGDWDGKTLDILLNHSGGTEVPNEVVDKAIYVEKCRLSWTWRDPTKEMPSLLKTLQRRVPEDPYLQKLLAETDFTPPPPKSPDLTPKPYQVPDAAKNSDIGRLKTLLDQGIDVDTLHGSSCGCDRNKGHGTALQRAVKQRDFEMSKLLLEYGADPNLQGGEFGNPLQEAAKAGDLQLVELLIAHKADVNLQGGMRGSPLIAAARNDDAKIVRYLIEHGADVNIADDHGWTPYLHAVAFESWDATRALLEVDTSLRALGELIALPPSKLVKFKDGSPGEISEDGLTVTTDTVDSTKLRKRIFFCADHPIISTSPFYFEISISRFGGEGIITMGVATLQFIKPDHNRWRYSSSDDGSWEYHGNTGHIVEEGDILPHVSYPTYGANDVVGCGVDFEARTIYFTKNGVRLDRESGVAFHMFEEGLLFPIIGIGSQDAEVSVKFGDGEAFMYKG